jgi:alpha-amylase
MFHPRPGPVPMIRTASLGILLLALAAPFAAGPGRAQDLPEWRRNGVCYQVFVRSFYDGSGDGVGDLRGLIERLDYINDGDPSTRRDLGASCIWLLPISPSPTYHGYDVTNYYGVNPDYGTIEDFRRLVAEADRRGIRIVVDLVLNHSSSEHPFFRSAALDPASPYRDWYRWSPTDPQERGPWGQEVWHRSPLRDEYYFGMFWGGMPDLNLANPALLEEAERISRFWLEEMGVAGFRLDAVSHFFEDGPVMKHAPRNHPWLRDFQAALRRIKPDVYTVGEVWDANEALLPYLPGQLDAYFSFEISDAIVDAARTGDGTRLLSVVERAQRDFPRGSLATFLRNHDQTRTMTEVGGDARRARLAASLLLTLPGLPYVYYGEEIGMTGDKPDPRLRTPMHWSLGPRVGFSTGVPWEPLQPDSLTANVEVQNADPASLLNHYRELIHLRTATRALGDGDFVPLETGHPDLIAYLRRAGEDRVLVVANLSDRRRAAPALRAPGTELAAGRRALRARLAGGRDGTLRVAADGRWTVGGIPALEPFEARILEIVPGR